MADSKITNLPEAASLTDDDLLVLVNAPGTTPATQKITVANALGGKADLSGATFTGDVSLNNSRLLLADGSQASPAISFTNDSDSGIYYAGGAVRVAFGGVQTFAFGGGIAYTEDLLPSATETSALGGTSNRWNTFYTKDGNFSGTTTITTADINGGDIDNTAIGETTPAAGTFTTLSAPSVTVGSVTNTTLREVLTSNRNYYVDGVNGSDANNGLSSGAGAFATIQKAIDVAYGNLDLNGYNVTVNVASQVATYAGFTASSPQVGKGTISVIGDTADPQNCTCGPSLILDYAVLTVGGLTFTGSSSRGLWIRRGATLTVATSIGLGTSAVYGIEVGSNSNIEAGGTTIYLYGNTLAVAHANGGAVNFYAANFTVPNNITVTKSFVSALNGSILLSNSSKSGAGTVTSGGVSGAADYSTAPAGTSGLITGTDPL